MTAPLAGRWAWPLLGTLILSSITDEITLITLTFRTAGQAAWAVPLLMVAELVPALAMVPFAGRLVDRGDPARLLVGASLAQAIVAAFLAASSSVASTLVGAALLGMLFSVSGTAIFALIPVVATASGLPLARANALLEVVRSGGMLAGPVVGGLLVAWGGSSLALAIDAASFALFAALLTMSGLGRIAAARDVSDATPKPGGILTDYLPLLRDYRLSTLIGVLAVGVAASAIADIAFVFLVTVTLAMGAPILGMLTACWAAGMLVGASIAGSIGRARMTTAAFAGAGVMGASMLVIGFGPMTGILGVVLVGVAFGIGGAANSIHNASVRTVLQTRMPEGAMGRTAALYVGATQAATISGYLLGGLFVPADAPIAYRIGGIASVLAAGIGWRLFGRSAGRR